MSPQVDRARILRDCIVIEQYPIADFINWLGDKSLILNPNFQRRATWTPAAKTYLIDTILREKPIPSIYMRSVIDSKTIRAYREVVDGQQRLRTIDEFVRGEWSLGARAGEFRGSYFQDLDDLQESFLSYRIGVVQLFGATDDDVLDVFARLNSFNYALNGQELRHGRYQGEFRGAVRQASSRWAMRLWDKSDVVGLRQRVRMGDDELMAQMLGVILDGIVDGGQPWINRLYEAYDRKIPKYSERAVDQVIDYIVENLSDVLETTGLVRGPHFLMLFAAVAHALLGLPEGAMKGDMPQRDPTALTNLPIATSNLGVLGEILESEEAEVQERLPRFSQFKLASLRSTQRISSRSVRFRETYRALLPEPV